MKSTNQTVKKFTHSSPVAVGTLFALLLTIACAGSELRGKSVSSPDGKTYLVIDDNNGGACGRMKVDGLNWPHPIHGRRQAQRRLDGCVEREGVAVNERDALGGKRVRKNKFIAPDPTLWLTFVREN